MAFSELVVGLAGLKLDPSKYFFAYIEESIQSHIMYCDMNKNHSFQVKIGRKSLILIMGELKGSTFKNLRIIGKEDVFKNLNFWFCLAEYN